jgi:hypothetical protein
VLKAEIICLIAFKLCFQFQLAPLHHDWVDRQQDAKSVDATARQGGAEQVDSIKPTLKAPGTQRSKLKYGKLLSSFAINFNLHRYIKDRGMYLSNHGIWRIRDRKVGRCRLALSNPL